jgi:hypothetical protein
MISESASGITTAINGAFGIGLCFVIFGCCRVGITGAVTVCASFEFGRFNFAKLYISPLTLINIRSPSSMTSTLLSDLISLIIPVVTHFMLLITPSYIINF